MRQSQQTYPSDEIYYFNAHRPSETVLALKDRYLAFSQIRDEVIRGIFEEKGYEIRNIKLNENSFGTGHVIYFIETQKWELVYRWNVWLETSEHYMSLEKGFTDLAKIAWFPTNELLESDTTRLKFDFDYQIMKVLPGLDLETQWNGTKEDYDKLSYELGKYIALEYKMPVEWWWRFQNQPDRLQGAKNSAFEYLTAYLDYDLNVLQEAWIFDEKARNFILNHFESIKPIINKDRQAYLVHHDLADHNIRYNPDNHKILALYDWENAVAFDPISEIGSAPTWVCHYPRAEQLKQWFLNQLWFKPEYFDEKIAIYFLRTMLWKMTFAVKGKRLSERHQQLLNTAFKQNNLKIDWLYWVKWIIEI
ncbi:MAG: hypothetical protein ACD_3C00226G0009 [uncultured bacterium (gcode 4)]|uniref:Aminoglycoside phosphotransferase domain-containing protein n=1 Tax=uncultured bacterium (gcode 4) TaxID=1234023 RepID=K2GVE4_9BACT|nr:MAG: hypothetical protein ACD_3C00226G0009 [uncultured bacterium (gcode 4)]